MFCAPPTPPAPEPSGAAVLAFEVAGGKTASGWACRAGDALSVEADLLAALGLKLAAQGPGRTPLAAIPGLSYTIDEALGVVRIVCTPACFPETRLSPARFPAVSQSAGVERLSGVSVDYDLSFTAEEGRTQAGAYLDAAVFAPAGLLENDLVLQDGRAALRLETALTRDFPDRRTRLRVGDGLSGTGAWGSAVRFAGVKLATDFSLSPSFITFPTPVLTGAAAAPAVVDVYVDGVRRYSASTPAGPFAIDDPPLVAGAGVATVVVTDALGRQQSVAAPFYASRSLLKPGLSDFSLDIGAERQAYGEESWRYGGPLAAASWRRGQRSGATLEGRAEGGRGHAAAGFSAAAAHTKLGHAEGTLALSSGVKGPGTLAKLGWTRDARALTLSLTGEAASAGFARLGDEQDARAARFRTTASTGFQTGAGAVNLGVSQADFRGESDVRSWNARWSGPVGKRATLALTAFHAPVPNDAFSVSVSLSAPLGARVRAGVQGESSEDGVSVQYRAQRTPDDSGGFGWRVEAEAGPEPRASAGASWLGPALLAQAEAAEADGATGVRLQAAGALGVAGRQGLAARSLREGFALVEAAPGMTIARENRPIGQANRRGRVVVSGLAPYTPQRLSIDPAQAPLQARLEVEEQIVLAPPRSGVRVRFAMVEEKGRWVALSGPDGAPAPEGALLTRAEDGVRFFVGEGGLAWLSAPGGTGRFSAVMGGIACVVELDAEGDGRCVRS